MQENQADTLIQQLVADGRVVVSPWRALILLRRAARATPRTRRSWRSPRTTAQVGRLLRHMHQQGYLAPIEGHRGMYQLVGSGARTSWPSEEELLFELMPYAMLSHRSALIHHGLTTLRPSVFTVTVPRGRPMGLVPVGTEAWEWEGLRLPGSHHPTHLRHQVIRTRIVSAEHFFGYQVDDLLGPLVRVSTLERTLVDGLLAPEPSDGLDTVLEAWVVARQHYDLSVDRIVDVVERYDVDVLRQRVGFVLDMLGLSHPRLAEWRLAVREGGSSRLVATAPFGGPFNTAWNLSINGPIGALEEAA